MPHEEVLKFLQLPAAALVISSWFMAYCTAISIDLLSARMQSRTCNARILQSTYFEQIIGRMTHSIDMIFFLGFHFALGQTHFERLVDKAHMCAGTILHLMLVLVRTPLPLQQERR